MAYLLIILAKFASSFILIFCLLRQSNGLRKQLKRFTSYNVLNYRQYLVCDLDERGEDEYDEQVVNDAECSDDDVDDLDCTVVDVRQILRQIMTR